MKGLMLKLLCVAWLTAVPGLAVLADEPPVPRDDLVFCTVCHGVQLQGNAIIKAPRLSGLSDWYIERQLNAFRNGWRGTHENDLVGMEMQPMAAVLSDEQIAAAADFAAATVSPLPEVTLEGDSDAGKTRYATCAACHGPEGRGLQALGGPALVGQSDWYLYEQLRKFRDGTRGAHPEDIPGQQMKAATQVLPDEQAMRDVIAYLATLADE